MPVIGFYDFNDPDLNVRDSALDNGAQDGLYLNGAVSSGGQLVLDGDDDFAKIFQDPAFQIDRGTLEITFTPGPAMLDGKSVVVSRDTEGLAEGGGFRLELFPNGKLMAVSETSTSQIFNHTDPGFVSPGDTINVSYSWDLGGEGGKFIVTNTTTGAVHEGDVPNTVTMNMGGVQQHWVVGADTSATPPGTIQNVQNNFQGTVDKLVISDSVDNKPGNQDPVATDSTATTDEDTPITLPVLDNVTDPDGDPLTVTSATATNGSVTINDDGSITYTPDQDYNGPDTIIYTVSDGRGGSTTGRVEMTVNPVNDDPVANPSTASTPFNTPVVIDPTLNDTDVDGDPITLFGTPTTEDGTVEVLDDTRISFTPNAGFIGTAVIDYTITDGQGGFATSTITVTVNAPERDGIVMGTPDDDLIDVNYTGDPDGDRIDNEDAILPGAAPNDDVVYAREGNDTVHAGLGDDLVYGGPGDDVIYGGPGNDTLLGDEGDDMLFGGEGDDILVGGDGNDTLEGGPGNNILYGGDDRDTFRPTAGDTVFGGSGGDDWDSLDLRGLGPLRVVDRVTDSDGNGFDGRVELLNGDGSLRGTINFHNIEEIIPCFTPGTLIATPRGERPVEDLRPGDKVITRDNGIQEIRWWGRKDMTAQQFVSNPHLRPVLIRQGSLGNGLPERDMLVSPNHRVLVTNDRTALYFDEHEVLVSAKHLVGSQGVSPVQSAGTGYIHFMFDRHEVVLSNGAWTESFQPGDYTLRGMGNAQRNEIFELFPELRSAEGKKDYVAARKTLKKHEASLLLK